MSKIVEANYVVCALCNKKIPLSQAIIDKGSICPELLRDEHERHEIEICCECYDNKMKYK